MATEGNLSYRRVVCLHHQRVSGCRFLQTGTITEIPLPPIIPPPVTFGGPDPCTVVVKREGDHRIASLGAGAACQNALIWLDIKRGGLLLTSFGINRDNQVITTGDVEISREDGGLIVREIGADGLRA